MEARLIGFEGETARVLDVTWPSPPPVLLVANPRFAQLDLAALVQPVRPCTVGMTFRLERLVGSDDGGPFLVYRRSS